MIGSEISNDRGVYRIEESRIEGSIGGTYEDHLCFSFTVLHRDIPYST